MSAMPPQAWQLPKLNVVGSSPITRSNLTSVSGAT